jgi:hypothetical protein
LECDEPPDPELDYLVRTFHHGYQDSPQPDTLPPGATPDAKNCLFAGLQLSQHAYPVGSVPPRATLQKRTGARLLTSAALAAGHGFDGLCEFRKVGQTSGRVVAVLNGKAGIGTTSARSCRSARRRRSSSGTKVRFFVSRNLLFIMDGTTRGVGTASSANDLFTPGRSRRPPPARSR